MSVFIVSEVGSNHNGSLGQALKLIDIAKEYGSDAVKFQLIKPFQPGWVDILKNYCDEVGIEFMATPFNQVGIEMLKGKVKHWKIASPEGASAEFIGKVIEAAHGDPIFISDGCTNGDVGVIQNIIPMACVMKYPAQEGEYHFYHKGKWGLSDHTPNQLLPLLAVAHGASVIEKHFTYDKTKQGPDHHYALNPAELKSMIQHIRLVEKILTNEKLTITEPERSIVWP